MKHIVLALLLLNSTYSLAKPPLQNSVLDFELGDSPEIVEKKLKARYPSCDLNVLGYKNTKGIVTNVTGQISIVRGSCHESTSDIADNAVDISFVHSDVDPKQPAYKISITRYYKEPGESLQIKYTHKDILEAISSKYGKPTNKVKEKSLIPNYDMDSKGRIINTKSYRMDWSYIWTSDENAKPNETCSSDKCGDIYLKVVITTNRINKYFPKNTDYVEWVSFDLVNNVLDSKQFDWSYEQDIQEKKENLSF